MMNNLFPIVALVFTVAGPASAAVVHNQPPDRGGRGFLPLSGFMIAEDFHLTQTTSLTSLSFWMVDGSGIINGQIDYFSGTMGWGIFPRVGSQGISRTPLFSGSVRNVTLTPSGLFSFSDEVAIATMELPGVVLAPGRYWLGLQEGEYLSGYDGSTIGWYTTFSSQYTPGSYLEFDSTTVIKDWEYRGPAADRTFVLEGEFVPEPITATLLGLLGLTTLGHTTNRRRVG